MRVNEFKKHVFMFTNNGLFDNCKNKLLSTPEKYDIHERTPCTLNFLSCWIDR